MYRIHQDTDFESLAFICIILAVIALSNGCAERDADPEHTLQSVIVSVKADASPKPLSYNRDIRPILSDKCFACHGPDAGTREADLRLDVVEDGEDYFGAYLAIEPGDPDNSELINRIHHTKSRFVMPPPDFGGVTLSDEEKALLQRWIKEGAEYEPHWAFTPISKPNEPSIADASWSHNKIDLFVLHKLEQRRIRPSPAAPLHTLLRRVALDVTGLPPDPQRVEQLLMENDAEKAYQTYVDELLDSPRFGERMASIWLDAARYADTNGHLQDHLRTMWPWRDWVINAYNNNLPYDQFIRDQIAGDLLPEPTPDQLIATGFNRNHGITTEGGSIDEEFRVEYAADRTNTMGAAILSLTLECARCHDHKYDPISQEDYFSLFAYFNSLKDEDPTPENNRAPAHKPLLMDAQSGQQVMIMREAAKPRPTYVLDRGQYDAPLKDRPVTRRPPTALGRVPQDAPKNRLGLAQWLTSKDNPLTARVEINRLWQTFFGTGLVKTSEDFGLQGEWPSHPALLNYLAKRFVDSGWDRKAMIRLIVNSATYRQSSHARPELAEIDPENRLLARMSRLRLSAEVIRDQALSASGLLVNQIGGPGVKPYQPGGLWREGTNKGSTTDTFVLGKGEELYRRSVYTFFKRNSPPPQMALFDAAARDACTVRRGTTNTALQALLLMNDPQHLEAARHLAAQAWQSEETDGDRLDTIFQRTLARSPKPNEAEVLLKGLAQYRVVYLEDPDAAQSLITQGQSPPNVGIKSPEHAAWTMIATTVFNLDEMVTRP